MYIYIYYIYIYVYIYLYIYIYTYIYRAMSSRCGRATRRSISRCALTEASAAGRPHLRPH